jgi:putative hydrolase of the HAD superfamily
MKKWILFDCMETLIDMTNLPKSEDYALWAFEGSKAEALWTDFQDFYSDYRAAKIDIEKELPRFKEYEMNERYRRILGSKVKGKELEKIVANMDEVFWNRYSSECYAKESVVEAVSVLSKEYYLGVVSNFKIRSGVRALLKKTGLLEHFEFTVNSCEIGWKKPHDQIYYAARELAGVDFDRIVFIGDDYANDYEKPKALGCRTLLYDPFGLHTKATYRIKDFNELLTSDIIVGEGIETNEQ